jgi:DNA (cytosine-5)-methyltransferase 1
MTTQLNVISLFTGVGGLDYGFEAAGFDTRVALELDAICCESLRSSRPSWAVIERDLLDTPSKDILKAARLRPGQVDMLIGGPPCQPFSKSGWWKSGDSLRLEDPRARTLSGYLRVLEETKPRAFLLENVEGLAFGGKDEGLMLLLDAITQINKKARTKYKPVVITLNAADYGVPQTRSRVFVIASRDGTIFQCPKRTHVDPDLSVAGEPWITSWDAIGDLQDRVHPDLQLSGKWADLLPSIPEGLNYLWHTERMGGVPLFGWRRRYWNFLLKLAKSRPAWTIQAQPGPATGPFHWLNRKLSADELMRLQTFPRDLNIVGNHMDIHKQLGNAVPSLLAEVLARAIREQFFGLPAPGRKPKLRVQRAGPCPPPHPAKRVPAKYLSLIGDHDPHPGTGRGYMYDRAETRA